MILELLHLEDFKSHQDTLIDFSTGTTTIMGQNGAGKSSIFEAVSFALFKVYTSKKINDLIRTGAKKMRVSLTFNVSGRTYQVIRERSEKTTRAILYEVLGDDLRALVQGDTEVNKYIGDLLEMDGDLFLNAVYIRQGEIADLVDKTPAEKKQMIGKLLGIDSLEKAWKMMKFITEKYEDDSLKLEGRLESSSGLNEEMETKKALGENLNQNLTEVNGRLEETIIECKMAGEKKELYDERAGQYEKITSQKEHTLQLAGQYKKSAQDLQYQLDQIHLKEAELQKIRPELTYLPGLKKLLKLKEDLVTLEKAENEINTKINEIRVYQNRCDETKDYSVKFNQVEKCITQLEEDRAAYDGSQVLYNRLTQEAENLESETKKLITELEGSIEFYANQLHEHFTDIDGIISYTDTNLPILTKTLEEVKENIRENQRKVSNLTILNIDLEKQIGQLKDVEGTCPICQSNITPEKQDELLHNYESQVQENEEKITLYKAEIENLEKGLVPMEIGKKGLEQTKIGIPLMQNQTEKIKTNNEALMGAAQEIKEVQKKVNHLELINGQIREKKEERDKIRELNQKYVAAKGALESLGDPSKYRNELRELRDEIDTTRDQISERTHVQDWTIPELEVEISRLEELKTRSERLLGELSQKQNVESQITNTKRLLEGAKENSAQLEKDIISLNYSEEAHGRIKTEFEEKNNLVNKLNATKHSITGQLDQLKTTIRELKEKQDEYLSLEKQLKNVKQFLKLLEYIREGYGRDGIQKELRNLSRPLIEAKTRELFEKFNFDYSDIQLDSEYNITIYGPGGESTLDMISGGEKIAVALALRLAITQVISGNSLELIMLDEPTIHLDEYRRQELIELLKKMSILPQMIIVTHDYALEEASDGIIRLAKEDGNSMIEVGGD